MFVDHLTFDGNQQLHPAEALGIDKLIREFLEKDAPSFPTAPLMTALEDTVPWRYRTWDRKAADVVPMSA